MDKGGVKQVSVKNLRIDSKRLKEENTRFAEPSLSWMNLTAFCGEHCVHVGGQLRGSKSEKMKMQEMRCSTIFNFNFCVCLFVCLCFQQSAQWTLSLFSDVLTGTFGIGRLNNVIFFSDEDECATGRHNCQHTCVNTPGSFRCGCPDGYMRNGITCVGEWYLLEDPGSCLWT